MTLVPKEEETKKGKERESLLIKPVLKVLRNKKSRTKRQVTDLIEEITEITTSHKNLSTETEEIETDRLLNIMRKKKLIKRRYRRK